ncbi:MAG TPA: asparagine synthase-related protein [Gemmatimonadaceae bacterium]|jgi:asparagine synthase (glutamine-hydrolysing)
MLGFAAVVDLDGAPLTADAAVPLASALAIDGTVTVPFRAEGLCGAHLAHPAPLDFDRALPCVGARGAVLFGALRLDAQGDLRRALRTAGTEPPPGAADAELAMAAWELWGERCAERLIGDFAFGIWEPASRRLTMFRDHHGNRQCYWGRDGSRLVLASSIEGVRAHAPLATAWREEAMAAFLRVGYVEDVTGTVWRDVHRVPPAHVATFSGRGDPRLRRCWEYPVPEPLRYRDGGQYVEGFLAVLGEAVRDRLRAPTAGIQLSGGLDSPMLAAMVRAVAPQLPLFAQTVSFPRLVPCDDDQLAPMVARQLGLAHDTLLGDDELPLAWLDDAAPYAPEPLDEPDLGVVRRSHAALARHAPVMFIGEDGDTLMRPPTLASQVRERGLAEVATAWWAYWRATGARPWIGLEWRARMRRALGRIPDRTPWLLAGARAPQSAVALVSHPVRAPSVRLLSSPLWDNVYQATAPSYTRAATLPTLPLVDPRVIAFVFAIPAVPWGEHKTLFREAMRGRLPEAIRTRPKTPLRGYYEARVAQWRAAGGAVVKLSPRVAPWVDRARAESILRDGAPNLAVEAWRVILLDRWMARMEGARA